MVTLNDEQLASIKMLHEEIINKLNEVIGGQQDLQTPKAITNPKASCLVSHAIGDQIEILHIINQAEGELK